MAVLDMCLIALKFTSVSASLKVSSFAATRIKEIPAMHEALHNNTILVASSQYHEELNSSVKHGVQITVCVG